MVACLCTAAGAWTPAVRLPGKPLTNALRVPRCARITAEVPIKSDADFDYFRRQRQVAVQLQPATPSPCCVTFCLYAQAMLMCASPGEAVQTSWRCAGGVLIWRRSC